MRFVYIVSSEKNCVDAKSIFLNKNIKSAKVILNVKKHI